MFTNKMSSTKHVMLHKGHGYLKEGITNFQSVLITNLLFVDNANPTTQLALKGQLNS